MYDTIIIGAGPAGCAAAYDLGRAGKSVLLLDRVTFPRLKACAGGLSVRAVKALRYSVSPVVRNVINKMILGTPAARWALLESDSTLFYMTVRSELDEYCLRQTKQSGAEFRVVKFLHGITQTSSEVLLSTSEGPYQGRFLIGADGANSQVRRMCGMAQPSALGFALEAHADCYQESTAVRFDFGAIRNGYGWVFPKGDHLNVGLCKYSMDAPFGREQLTQYAQSTADAKSVRQIAGQYVGCDPRDPSPVQGRVLLAGDAAGFADALTGEGIYHAIVSGQAAAGAILRQFPDATNLRRHYSQELELLHSDLSFCREFASFFYSHLEFGKTAFRLARVRRAFLHAYASGEGLRAGMSTILPSLRQRWRTLSD